MAHELSTDERAEKDREELLALRALGTSTGWTRFFLSHLDVKRQEHLDGLSGVALESAKRAEHIHAFHLTRELAEWLPRRVKALEESLRRYRQQS